MTCNIASTPRLPDALPPYTARQSRDSDSTSIRSAAPSYTSEAPSYHSFMPPPAATPSQSRDANTSSSSSSTRRPNPTYAPGFIPALPSRESGGSTRTDISMQQYNIPSWSSVSSSHQARHYQNVANRRATLASAESERAALAFAANSLPRPQPPPDSSADLLEEDPYLVGGEAAARAKRERLQRTRRGDEVLRQEDKAWDFMTKQMADWDERERSWDQFRRDVQRRGVLSRRLGVLGRVSF